MPRPQPRDALSTDGDLELAEIQQTFSQYALFAWLLLLALVVLALAWQYALDRRVNRLSRHYAGLTKGVDGLSLLDALDQHVAAADRLERRVEGLAADCRALEEGLGLSLRRVGLIRFNPFSDTGGDQSFALALLDDKGDGIVLSAIFGRSETRVFAKPVKDGRSKHALSAEEEQAICQASLAR